MKIKEEKTYKIELGDENNTEIRINPSALVDQIGKWWDKGKNFLETIKDKLIGDD